MRGVFFDSGFVWYIFCTPFTEMLDPPLSPKVLNQLILKYILTEPHQYCISVAAYGVLRGRSRISGKGIHMYKGVGFALLILSDFSYISHENVIIWSY